MSPRALIKAILRKSNIIGENFIKKCHFNIFGANINDREFFKCFGILESSFTSSTAIREHLQYREKPVFFVDPKPSEATLSAVSRESIIEKAEQICSHTFDLLGSGEVNLGEKINWHCDFKTDYQWEPRKYYQSIEIPYGRADIKVPWELSRFQHLGTLGQAYLLTKDERYTREFISQISSWIEDNPPKLGVNWMCTMDVSIRVANWILGYSFFKDSEVIGDEFLMKLLKSFLIHGRHIMGNLENKSEITTNHYLSNIVGMVYLGVMFPEFKEAKKWRTFGIQELKVQLKKQVYADGCDYEASTCYHRLVLELFFFPTLLVVINDSEFDGGNYQQVAENIFGNEYKNKLYKIFEVVLYALKPNGLMSQIGDNDNGRLHSFSEREILDMRYLLALGAVFFAESRFKVKEFALCEEVLWIFGDNGLKVWEHLEENQLVNIGSFQFPDAGWYIMRDKKNHMMISCGPNGQKGVGGHCHNDNLSFDLCVDGENVIIDPGTYLYTRDPEMRNRFRSTAYHNTVVINDCEQNRLRGRSLFEIRDGSKTKNLRWDSDAERDLFIGEHYGYKRLKEPVIHKRSIQFFKKDVRWLIRDEFYAVNSDNVSMPNSQCVSQKFQWYLHLSSQIVVEHIQNGEFIFRGKQNILGFKVYNLPCIYNLDTENYWLSTQYGEKTKSILLKVEFQRKVPFQIEFEVRQIHEDTQ